MGCSISTFIKFSYECRIRTLKPSVMSWCSKFVSDVGRQRQWKSGILCLVLVRSGRRTADSLLSRYPVRISTESGQNIDRQTPLTIFSQIPDRIQTADIGPEFREQKWDKDRTRTALSTDVWLVSFDQVWQADSFVSTFCSRSFTFGSRLSSFDRDRSL